MIMNKKKIHWGSYLFIIFFMVAIPIFYMVEIPRWTKITQVCYCMNDVYCFAQYNSILVTLPLIQLIIIQNIKSEFRVNIIVQLQKMSLLWIRFARRIFMISLFCGLYMWIWVTVIGLFHAQLICNWNVDNSFVFAKTGGTYPVNVVWFMLLFIIVSIVHAMVWGMLITIIWWNTWQPVIGITLMMVMAMLEQAMYPAAVHIFFSVINMEITYMYGMKPFGKLMIYACLWVIGTFVAGFLLIRKKDFLRRE